MNVSVSAIVEPDIWLVVFERKASSRFVSFIAMGRLKHVFALTWLPAIGAWIVYDPGYWNTNIYAVAGTPDGNRQIAAMCRGSVVVRMPRRKGPRRLTRAGLFCTSAIRHLVGMTGSALRPDTLLRHALAQGGAVIDENGGAGPAGA